ETEGETLKKTIDAANILLAKLGIDPVQFSLLKTLSPYDNSEIVFAFDGFELPAAHGGSGVEMLVSLALLEALAMLSKEKLIILIDEPELHLHPKLQARLVEHLSDLSASVQIIASTHSPLIFKNVFRNSDAKLQITKREMGAVKVVDAHSAGFGYLGWSPSWGEICYLAYDLPTAEFHDDLYGALEDRFRGSPNAKTSQADFDMWLVSHGYPQDVKWTGAKGEPRAETLMTYVRNRIHHPENHFRPAYTEAQLAASIEGMCNLLKKLA
ncbi:MAG: AAA family ATPase, partial [Rhizobiaceae bacterium]